MGRVGRAVWCEVKGVKLNVGMCWDVNGRGKLGDSHSLPSALLPAEMGRLRKALEQHAAALGIPRELYMPKNTQAVLIHHKAELTAKVGGCLWVWWWWCSGAGWRCGLGGVGGGVGGAGVLHEQGAHLDSVKPALCPHLCPSAEPSTYFTHPTRTTPQHT